MACPRCKSTLVEPLNRDGDYDCIMCGQVWPKVTREERLQKIHDDAAVIRASDEGKPRRGRPPKVKIVFLDD